MNLTRSGAIALVVLLAAACVTREHPRPAPRDDFLAGHDSRCPRSQFFVGVGCAADLGNAQRLAHASVSEQVIAKIETEAALHYQDEASVEADRKENRLRISSSARVGVRSHFDGTGFIRIVDTIGRDGGDVCVLACLSLVQAAHLQRSAAASLRDQLSTELRELNDLLQHDNVLDALPRLRRARQTYADHREAVMLLAVFAPGTSVEEQAARELLEAQRQLREKRSRLGVSPVIELRSLGVRDGMLERSVEATVRDALWRLGVAGVSPMTHVLLVQAIQRCSDVSPRSCDTSATVTLSRGGFPVRSGVVTSGATRASRPSLTHASARSAALLADEVERLIREWFDEEWP